MATKNKAIALEYDVAFRAEQCAKFFSSCEACTWNKSVRDIVSAHPAVMRRQKSVYLLPHAIFCLRYEMYAYFVSRTIGDYVAEIFIFKLNKWQGLDFAANGFGIGYPYEDFWTNTIVDHKGNVSFVDCKKKVASILQKAVKGKMTKFPSLFHEFPSVKLLKDEHEDPIAIYLQTMYENLSKIKEERRQLDDAKRRKDCVICLQDVATMAAVPCGHFSFCAKCCVKIKTCSICRANANFIKIY